MLEFLVFLYIEIYILIHEFHCFFFLNYFFSLYMILGLSGRGKRVYLPKLKDVPNLAEGQNQREPLS